jgi:hypothetical protein
MKALGDTPEAMSSQWFMKTRLGRHVLLLNRSIFVFEGGTQARLLS